MKLGPSSSNVKGVNMPSLLIFTSLTPRNNDPIITNYAVWNSKVNTELKLWIYFLNRGHVFNLVCSSVWRKSRLSLPKASYFIPNCTVFSYFEDVWKRQDTDDLSQVWGHRYLRYDQVVFFCVFRCSRICTNLFLV